jgi:hypothetical protein
MRSLYPAAEANRRQETAQKLPFERAVSLAYSRAHITLCR